MFIKPGHSLLTTCLPSFKFLSIYLTTTFFFVFSCCCFLPLLLSNTLCVHICFIFFYFLAASTLLFDPNFSLSIDSSLILSISPHQSLQSIKAETGNETKTGSGREECRWEMQGSEGF